MRDRVILRGRLEASARCLAGPKQAANMKRTSSRSRPLALHPQELHGRRGRSVLWKPFFGPSWAP
eukprot:7081155-Pyramimonas_sp.AAC.1